jgi:hypothetical protein
MSSMSSATVIPLDRSRRVTRAVDASRRLRDARIERRDHDRPGGRVWLNGGELGGARAAFAHLGESYD